MDALNVRVYQGDAGQQMGVFEHHLFVAGRIRNNGNICGFAAGTRGGWYGDHRHAGMWDGHTAHVAPQPSRVGGTSGDRLGGVNRAATAERNHEVCTMLLQGDQTILDIAYCGVGLYLAEHRDCYAHGFEQGRDARRQPICGEKGISHDQCARCSQAFGVRGQTIQCACARDYRCGNGEGYMHLSLPPDQYECHHL